MESVLIEKSVNGGVLFRSFSSSFSLDNSFPYINKTLTCTQPPLLPLPSVNPWKERGMLSQHHRHKNTRHASTSPRKREQRDRFLPVPVPVSVPALVSIPVPISVLPVSVPESISAKALRDAGEEEVVWTGAVYSVSPPPSSVPMPSFVMARGRGATKVADKACAEDSGVDASATNELRKLLKLQEKDSFFNSS